MFKLFFILMGLMTSTYASDAIIVHSDVDTLSSGQLLNEQAVINLTENSEITAAFATGGVQTLKGPYQGKLSDPLAGQPSDSTLLTELAQVIHEVKTNPEIRGRFQDNTKLWRIDVSDTQIKHHCVPASQQLLLSRPEEESKLASTVLIKHKETDEQTQITWPARQMTLEWPNTLPLVYGDTYTVTVKSVRGQTHFKMVVLYRLPDSLPTDSHKIVWMAGKGCMPQAEMLLAGLR